ncbi:salivary acidic proline-rich phosphoprotein 1/2-like [Sorex fumeus]|uniref:salivary acidic proline-rich phosphoprotein 1/2-like n=1 Tax=Sorex fumeus TaxID=62283 RepID=UPI0024AE6AAE|nr:salivary acidic proline-rich phosphoprotein 1/2-like [Sorex fumeus]
MVQRGGQSAAARAGGAGQSAAAHGPAVLPGRAALRRPPPAGRPRLPRRATFAPRRPRARLRRARAAAPPSRSARHLLCPVRDPRPPPARYSPRRAAPCPPPGLARPTPRPARRESGAPFADSR